MIDKDLIEKSLTLCWRKYSDMDIEHYCYFLLSPEFIEKYAFINYECTDEYYKIRWVESVWRAVYEYQKWNETPLITLLEKIK